MVQHLPQVLRTAWRIPANPAVAHAHLPGRGPEAHGPHHTRVPVNQIAQLGTGQRPVARRMVPVDEPIPQRRVRRVSNRRQVQTLQIPHCAHHRYLSGPILRLARQPLPIAVTVARRRQLDPACPMQPQQPDSTAHQLGPTGCIGPPQHPTHPPRHLGSHSGLRQPSLPPYALKLPRAQHAPTQPPRQPLLHLLPLVTW